MPPMMTGSSSGACFRISASRAAMSGRRFSSTAAMYSAGVFTSSCPFMGKHCCTFCATSLSGRRPEPPTRQTYEGVSELLADLRVDRRLRELVLVGLQDEALLDEVLGRLAPRRDE